ncbi:SDR family oxidoreductase [Actinacidiphila sp. DG2A-62]|uniref:SDR family NAD(P)-dependent oxidoreductase n=1 Tax=Actinacidiphila sp. DG2A-62 TaxID=3108821 RepID=UPI002DB87742|nr:SDR family oxidoreductase [Actinacidiphila sp. DG2A-62]MEC3992751.1 SDR family oxidoreductase [Actinacidiphila sp. DG2A-62]
MNTATGPSSDAGTFSAAAATREPEGPAEWGSDAAAGRTAAHAASFAARALTSCRFPPASETPAPAFRSPCGSALASFCPSRDAPSRDLRGTSCNSLPVLVAELAPGMAERGAGVIVNIGSWMARVGVPYKALCPATKAAVEQLTRAWAAEYGPRGVRVNTVAPGATATRGTSADADRMAELTKGTPAGAPVRPVDIAYAVRFLASDQAALVHGATLDVDGGIAATRLR